MALLYLLADIFIKTFGITQPSDKTRRQAAFFILALMVMLVLLVGAAGVAVFLAIR